MESRQVFDYIWFGTALRYLIDLTEGHEIDVHHAGVTYNIEELGRSVERFGFKVSAATSALADLKEIGKRLQKRADDAPADEVPVVTKDDAHEINVAALKLRETLDAESTITYAFVVQPKRFETNKLTANVGALMPAGCFDALDDMARFDLGEAGRCIAFERPTAAAFHLMRAVEAELRCFYCDWVRSSRIGEPRMWGPMVIDMRKKTKRPPTVVLDALDHVRVNFRNPTQHPDATYTVDEAQDLFALAIDVINRMVSNPRSA